MEIIIKAKQKFNPFFSFLDFGDELNPYYRYLLHAVSSGTYIPQPQSVEDSATTALAKREGSAEKQEVLETPKENGDDETSEGKDEEKSSLGDDERESTDDSDSDDEGFELHPLLRTSNVSKSSKPATPTPEANSATEEQTRTSSSTTFYAKSFRVNSAPLLESEAVSSHSREDQSQMTYHSTDSQYPHQPYGR